jgi:eukaryotic-like serine/threonine-protein kinase
VNGQTISHYHIVSRIGSGGMGEVYLARDERLDRRVALKLLPVEFNPDPERVVRFQQEARAASALDHPGILTIFEVGEAAGRHFIATEYIDGQTLRKRLDRGALSVKEVVRIASEITAALTASHAAGVVHRDIKPENVMVRRDGYVKVLDFGLAKFTEARAGARFLNSPFQPPATAPGLVMGTVHYMSPEQLRGEPMDQRSDLFSLGVLMYEMLTATPAFSGRSTSDVIAAILEHEPVPISEIRPGVPPELQSIISIALNKDAADRYQSGREMLNDLRTLERLLDHQEETIGLHESKTRLPGPGNGTAPAFSQRLTRRTGRPADLVQAIRANRDVLISLALIVGLIVAALLYFSKERTSYGSLAVLPFSIEGSDLEADYLGEGITESIIHAMSEHPGLQVIARSTMFRYKGQQIDPQQVGRELKVTAILMGRVLQQGDRLVVRADLIDVERGTQLWGAQYVRRPADLLAIQSEIATEISEHLRIRLSGVQRERMASQRQLSDTAYRNYLKGRYLWNRRTAEGLRAAIEHFEAAIAEEPGFSRAYAGLADCYALLPLYAGTAPEEAWPRAKAAALKALELDDELAEAHTSLAWARMNYERDWGGAENSFRRAIELNRSYPTAHQWYSLYLSAMGRHEEALREIGRALELDPLSPMINLNVGTTYYLAGRYDEALERLRRAGEMEPDFVRGRLELARIFEMKEMHEQAIPIFEELAGQRRPEYTAALARSYALAGRRNDAVRLLEQLLGESGHPYVNPYDLAAVYVALGETDLAFERLEHAYETNVSRLAFLRVEPMFEELRADPRFRDLARRLRLE